jgi:hypothetical protein
MGVDDLADGKSVSCRIQATRPKGISNLDAGITKTPDGLGDVLVKTGVLCGHLCVLQRLGNRTGEGAGRKETARAPRCGVGSQCAYISCVHGKRARLGRCAHVHATAARCELTGGVRRMGTGCNESGETRSRHNLNTPHALTHLGLSRVTKPANRVIRVRQRWVGGG